MPTALCLFEPIKVVSFHFTRGTFLFCGQDGDYCDAMDQYRVWYACMRETA